MSDEAVVEVEAGVATITPRPAQTPATSRRGRDGGAADGLDRPPPTTPVRVVVLTGTGTTFCAGADLRGRGGRREGSFAGPGPRPWWACSTAMLDHPKPTIAKVQGHVAGGGNGLVAACDLAVAADPARFAFSEVRLGVAPAVISVVCLPKLSRADAMELFLFGERVPARRLVQAGMLNAAVPPEDLDAAVQEWIGKLRAGGPRALAGAKALINRVPTMARDEAFAWTAARSGEAFRSAEAAEGIGAFLQKRQPNWV